MRLVDFLGAVAPLLGAIAAVLLATRGRTVRGFQQAGASSAAMAQPLTGRRLVGWWERRLAANGVLKTADGTRYWLDDEAWQAYQSVRKRRGLTIGISLATALLAAAAIAKFR